MIFDTHTHLVAKIDDGSRTYDETLKLIDMAKIQGIVSFMLTPHYYVNKPSDPVKIREFIEKLKNDERLKAFKFYEGNEVLYFDSMVEKLKSKEILTLADSRYVLIEFYPNDSYKKILKAVKDLRYNGYFPIIAHAERFKALIENGLSELISLGAYIQISFSAITKGIFNKEGRCVRKWLKDGNVHFLGSDMHRIDKRPPDTLKAEEWIYKNIENAEDILFNNAIKIVDNRDFLFK